MNIINRMWLIPMISLIVFFLFLIGMFSVIWFSHSASNRLVEITSAYQPILKELSVIKKEITNIADMLEEAVITNEVDLIDEAEEKRAEIDVALTKLNALNNDRASLLRYLIKDYFTLVFDMTREMLNASGKDISELIQSSVDSRNGLFDYLNTFEKEVDERLNRTVYQTRDEIKQSTITISVSFIVVSLILSIGTFSIVKSTNSKLKSLMSFANAVENGDFSMKLDSNVQDEFSSLVNALESMANSIKQSSEQLTHMAHYDGLANVQNHRAIIDRLGSEIKSVKRHRYKLSFCMCDVDKFKHVNDTYGHQVGDLVISQFAKLLKNEVREEDVVGRYGGDEFCIILPHTSATDAKVALERIRINLSNLEFESSNFVKFKVTGSFGVADFEEGEEVADIIKKADEALYQSKEGGRNLVSVYET